MELLASYLLASLIIMVLSLLIYIKTLLRHWKKQNIPYLEPSIPFGNLPNPITNKKALVEHFHDFYRRFKKIKAKCGGIYLFCSPTLLVIEPESIKQILSANFQHFHERGFYNCEKYQPICGNLFALEGERWRNIRTKFTPTFTSAKMKIMFDLMLDAGELLVKHVEEHLIDKKALNAKDCAGRVTTDIIGNCAFGIECFEDNTIVTVFKESIRAATSFLKLSFCNAMPKLAQFLRIPMIPNNYARFLNEYIDETIKCRRENGTIRNDFLQLAIAMNGKGLISVNELKAQCLLFFLAGYESSTNTTAFLLFELAHNQHIQRKLRDEIRRTINKDNGEITYDAVANLKYLDMVLCETLRKYPTIGFLARKCVKKFDLPNSNITIEKDTKIVIPVYGLHYDPEYFPDPQKFDPERFSDKNASKLIPYTYLPFGKGPRNCIGDRFAKQAIKTIVMSLIRRYNFKLNTMVEVPLILNPTGLFTSAAEEILLDVEGVQE